jgi:hypothetical protein
VSSALNGAIRTGGDRGLFEYAAGPINVNESARSVAAGTAFSRREIILLDKDRRALQARVRCRKIGGLVIRSS